MKKVKRIILISVFSICGWLIYSHWSWINTVVFQGYSQAPDFQLEDFLGKVHSSNEFYGKPLIISMWATDDPFAADDLRALAEAQSLFGNKITIIAVNRGELSTVAREFADKLTVSSRIFFLLDPTDSFYKAINGFRSPETIFVNKERNIIDRKHGTMKLPEIRQRVERIL